MTTSSGIKYLDQRYWLLYCLSNREMREERKKPAFLLQPKITVKGEQKMIENCVIFCSLWSLVLYVLFLLFFGILLIGIKFNGDAFFWFSQVNWIFFLENFINILWRYIFILLFFHLHKVVIAFWLLTNLESCTTRNNCVYFPVYYYKFIFLSVVIFSLYHCSFYFSFSPTKAAAISI